MAFCVACGNKVQNEDVFCMHCGKRRLPEQKQTEELPTLTEFMGIKSEERINRFVKRRGSDFGSDNSTNTNHPAAVLNGGSISKRKRSSDLTSRTKSNELVTIQVGIISGDEKDETLHIIRGSRLPIKIPKNAGSQEILEKSIEKHSNHDQFFCGVEDWSLLYPDQKKVEYIPGTNIPFTLQQYKEDLGKPFSKIDLYLCKAYYIMNREIATIDNELKQSLDMFNTGNFLGLGEYDDENLNDDVLLPELISKPCCGTSASSGVIDLTKTPSDLVSDMKNKPVVKPSIDTNDSGMSSNPSGTEKSGKTSTFETSCGYCPVCNKKIPFAIIEVHANECLNKKQQPIIYSVDSVTREEDKDYEIEEDKDVEIFTDGDVNTIDYKKQIPVVLKHCNIAKEEALIHVRRHYEFQDFQKFFSKKWNNKKLNKAYRISYVGEPAIDTGGVSRDFYSGMVFQT